MQSIPCTNYFTYMCDIDIEPYITYSGLWIMIYNFSLQVYIHENTSNSHEEQPVCWNQKLKNQTAIPIKICDSIRYRYFRRKFLPSDMQNFHHRFINYSKLLHSVYISQPKNQISKFSQGPPRIPYQPNTQFLLLINSFTSKLNHFKPKLKP